MNLIIQTKMQLMHKAKFLIFFLIIIIIANGNVAQEQYDLSMVIREGLERNFSLQVVRNHEQIAANNHTWGNAGMLPTISATNRFGGTLNTTHQQFRDGDVATSKNVHNTSGSAAINLGMTIFNGFYVQNTYQKLGMQSDLQSLSTQMSIENLIARITSEYHYYIQQLNLYENMSYAVTLSRERVRIDEERYNLGGVSKLELLQSQVYLNADSSRLARQNEVLRAAQIRLNELMAAEDLGRIIILKDTCIIINEDLLYDELYELTMQFNTSLKIASKSQAISELDYNIIKSRSYPYLTMSSGYSFAYSGYETGSMDYQHVRGANYGLTLGVPIYDGLNRRRERSNALIEIENRRIQYQEIEQEVKGDLLTLYYAYENNLRLLRLEEQNLEVARENHEIALERYKLGNLSGIELREVQKSLLDAEERLVSVKYLTKLAEISLLQISGLIMEYL